MRTIESNLQVNLDAAGGTRCFLIKFITRTGVIFGVTSLDVAVTYNDGLGELTYSAAIGLDQSPIQTSASLEVDNSEAKMLIADAGNFTSQDIETGVLDYARFIVYRVNWRDYTVASPLTLTPQRHYIVQSGTTGAIKEADGMLGIIELRGLPQGLKQSFNELYSITCRARFGSGVGEALFPCNFDAEALWDNGDVASVGAETDRIFTATTAPTATGPNGALGFGPGLLEWLTGDNVGLTSEIETVVGSVVSFRFPTPFPMTIADTYKARPDCGKRFAEDCVAEYDNFLNFRGEYLIPLADESSQSSPGAIAPIDLGLYRSR